MHLRTIVLLFLIGLNLVLGIGWGFYYFNNSVYSRNPIIRDSAAGSARPRKAASKSPASARRPDWQKIESDNYSTYIQNLRAIGCPESTIRDIIIAEVNRQFDEEHPGQQSRANQVSWWKSETTGSDSHDAEMARVQNEKRDLLAELLGPDWDRSGSEVPEETSGVNLEGPVLAELSEKNKKQVHEISARARRKMESYAQSQNFLGQPVDPIHLAQLRQQMRNELAQVLNPAQMEEFLLRYSETANRMRTELRGLEITPDEFRNIFRIRDPLETDLALLGAQTSGPNNGRLRVLQGQIDSSILQTLGTARYLEYRLNQNPLLVETRAQANRLGLPQETTFSILEITQETLEEQQRIDLDASLTPAQRIDSLAATEAERQKALLQLLGAESFQRWQQHQSSR